MQKAAGAGCSGGRGGVVTSEVTTPPEQVEEYWTDERIRDAQPREQRLDSPER